MSRANKNLPEQHWVNAAHSYLQTIDLDTFAVTNDPTTPSLGKSEALASIQHQNDSQRINSQQTSHLSPKARTWSKGNGVNSPRIYREGAIVFFPFRFIEVDWLNQVFLSSIEVTKRRSESTGFSDEQRRLLEKAFLIANYPDNARCKQLAHDLHLKESVIKFWFQTRRAKQRRILNLSKCSCLRQSEKKTTNNVSRSTLRMPLYCNLVWNRY